MEALRCHHTHGQSPRTVRMHRRVRPAPRLPRPPPMRGAPRLEGPLRPRHRQAHSRPPLRMQPDLHDPRTRQGYVPALPPAGGPVPPCQAPHGQVPTAFPLAPAQDGRRDRQNASTSPRSLRATQLHPNHTVVAIPNGVGKRNKGGAANRLRRAPFPPPPKAPPPQGGRAPLQPPERNNP
jgi:hypothetical protein